MWFLMIFWMKSDNFILILMKLYQTPVHPLTLQDFDLAGRGGLGEWRQEVEELHLGLSDFIHRVVVHRSEEATRCGIG